MATLIAIADAVVAELNSLPWSQPFTAQRHYQPRFDLTEMAGLQVSVVPRGLSSKGLDRWRRSFDYQIDVAIQQKPDMGEGAWDALMRLVEEIADYFSWRALRAYPDAKCVEVKNEPVYALEHLEELRLFTSVLTLTFRVWR